MENRVFEAEHAGLFFRIEQDCPEVGAYLYVYESGSCIKDELQDSVDVCKKIAFEAYGVPIENWR